MERIDIEYLCTIIGNLSGIPIRIYENGKQNFYYSIVNLVKDPICVCEEKIMTINESIGYYSTDHFNYYGIVNSKEIKIVIGPTRQMVFSDKELNDLAFSLDIVKDDIPSFVLGMKSISHLSLEKLLQVLCALNYVLNGEQKTLEEIAIYDEEQENIKKHSSKDSPLHLEERNDINYHNTYDLEELLMTFIRKGDTAALRKWISKAPAVNSGIIAPDQLRQQKNLFIVTATLASRSAIRGGMVPEDAFSLSDTYIQKCELLSDPSRITNLQYHMIIEFTEHVERLRLGTKPTKLIIDVANYVQHHISESISTEEIAKELYISRPYLSKRFKSDSGLLIKDFVLKEKIEEAKRLLRYSDKSLSQISMYLGFSSQSHFTRVFNKYAGVNPGEYREKHINHLSPKGNG